MNIKQSKKLCNLILTTLFYCVILIKISAEALVITDCSSGSSADATLGTVTVDGCSINDDNCPLVRGQNASINFDFTTVKGFRQARLEVAGKVGIWIPFPLKPEEACGNYGFSCPVKPNENKKLHLSLPIQRTWPKLKVDVRVKMLDENKNLIVCFVIPVRITDPSSNNNTGNNNRNRVSEQSGSRV